MQLSLDPTEAFHALSLQLRQARQPYVVATVIEVFGSSSARTGSKAIFDAHGKNLLGWVGGGCAEQHVAEQSLAALAENRTRIIEADLDDELYGLGVACGGKMNLFLEPILPAEEIVIETDFPEEAKAWALRYGWKLQTKDTTPFLKSTPHNSVDYRILFLAFARAIATKRGRSGKSLREMKELPVHFQNLRVQNLPLQNFSSSRVTLVGQTRITQAIAAHFQVLGCDVRVVGPLLKELGKEEGPEIRFAPGERVIVASHTAQDSRLVEKILKCEVGYLAMVGSRKRALEVLHLLHVPENATLCRPLYVPAGLDLDAKNPEEVALSIVAECLIAFSA